MKIALAQLNYHIGNFQKNSQKIIDAINEAKTENADLIVFSELAVCGYSPLDLLESKLFIQNCEKTVKEISAHCDNIAVIIGAPVINKDKGKKLFNAGLFIYNKEIKHTVRKTLLPNYDVFNESRYFEHNSEFEVIEFKGKKIALTICEDLWDEQSVNTNFEKAVLYEKPPLKELIKNNPDFIINISGSPYSYNQFENRKEILIKNAIKYRLPVVYVNQVGANTDLIYDGGSLVMSNKGEVIKSCKYFEEDLCIIDTSEFENSKIQIYRKPNKIADINKALVLGIKDFFDKNGFSKAILGLSGGIDSALTLALAIQAIGNKNVEVLLMPSKYSSRNSIEDAKEMAEKCNVKYYITYIENIRQIIEQNLNFFFANTKSDATEENIQARIRSTLLMAFANKFGYILLNTSNKSEAAVGYTTLYGDMCGGLSVLGDVYKTDIYKLSRYINENISLTIPQSIINKVPTAELRYNQKDSDSLPEYEILDGILFNYIEKKLSVEEIHKLGYEKEMVRDVLNMVNRSEHKRFQSSPILRVSSKAFGCGRRMPLVAKY